MKDRRAYRRYAVRLEAVMTPRGLAPHPCVIRDFCLGGMFLGLEDGGGDLVVGDYLEVGFSVAADAPVAYRLGARVARTLSTGVGVAFVEPDPAALVALQRLASRAQAAEATGRTDAQAASRTLDATLVADCEALVEREIGGLYRNFFARNAEGLIHAADHAQNNVEQTAFFAAVNTLNRDKTAIGEAFVAGVRGPLRAFLERRDGAQEEEEGELELELSLMEKEEFEDLLSVAEITSRAENRYEDSIADIGRRASKWLGLPADRGCGPLSPEGVTHAFHAAVEGLGLEREAMNVLYASFQDVLLEDLGDLYQELMRVLDRHGVTEVEPAKPRVKRAPPTRARPRPGGAEGPPGPADTDTSGDMGGGGWGGEAGGGGPGGMVGPAWPGGGPGMAAAPGAPAGPAGAAMGPPPAAAWPQSPGAVAPGPAMGAMPGMAGPAAGPAGYAPAAGAMPPGPGAPAGAGPGSGGRAPGSYGAAQSLLELLRSVAPGPAQPSGAAYSPQEIVQALSELERQVPQAGAEMSGPAFTDHLLETLQRQHADEQTRRLAERESDVLEVVGHMVDALLQETSLSPVTKQRIERLAMPVRKVAVSDTGFLASEQHPARQVLNQVARLDPTLEQTGEGAASSVDPVIDRIAASPEAGPGTFEAALPELDRLVEAQQAAYADNVGSVVRAQERQQAFLKARRKGRSESQRARPVTPEWEEWLERGRHVEVGDVLDVDDGSGRVRRLSLAWTGEDHNPLVLVDKWGRKAATLTLQELAMQLRRGQAQRVDEADLSPTERGLYELLRDVHSRIEHRATHDPATDLPTRPGFERSIGEAMKTAVRQGQHHVLGELRLSQLRLVRDSYGAHAAEALLEDVAERLRARLAGRGSLAYLGEDRFGLLLDQASLEDGRALAKGLAEAVHGEPFRWGDDELTLDLSAGLVPVDAGSEHPEGLLQAAHSACSAAQEAGRGRVQAYSAEDTQMRRQTGMAGWARRIGQVLEQDRLMLRAQRIQPLGADTSARPHYEILLGLRDEEGQPIPPQEFVEAAEYYDQMPALDRWIVHHALQWMVGQRGLLRELSGFALNLSGQSLSDPGLVEFMMEQFSTYPVPPGKIIFEVTETAAVARLSNAERFIRTLGELGCRFSLDDFGSGHSSYGYLKKLPVDYVKIDGQFVREMHQVAEDRAVVSSINEIAHVMGKKTIAEYVENVEIANLLREIGVDYAQGYWVERPRYLGEGGMDTAGDGPRPEAGAEAPGASPARDDPEPPAGGDDAEGTLRF